LHLQTAFRIGVSTRLDDRVFAMCEMKSLPLDQLIQYIYPNFYSIDSLFVNINLNNGENNNETTKTDDSNNKLQPVRLQLSAEK
jgi:protein transport protein SEC24